MRSNENAVIYHERLLDSIAELESLQDRESFGRLLSATAIEQTTALTFDPDAYVHIFKDDLPVDLTDKLYFPDRLWIHGVRAQITELTNDKPAEAAVPDWALTFSFSTTSSPQKDPVGTEFTLISTPLETVCTTTNLVGEPMTSRGNAITGQRLLLAILGSAIANETSENEVYQNFKEKEERMPLSPTLIKSALTSLGQRFGTSRKITLSYLPHPDTGDKVVAIRTTEEEAETSNQRAIDFYLNSQLASGQGEAKHTAMLSAQMDHIKHDEVVMRGLNQHYAKRFPTDVSIDEMSFAVRLGYFDQVNIARSSPNDFEQYGLIATTILTVIKPNLRPYLIFDRTDGATIGSETYFLPE